MLDKKMIEDMLYTNPLSLLAIKDKQVIAELNNLVPYSTAFEIECDYGANYDRANFAVIPDIMDISNDAGEQRYRIPNGLRGIICLYHISVQLKLNSLLNPASSIHYHVDCTDCYPEICKLVCLKHNAEYILSELDTWLEGDTARDRCEGYWFKVNSLQTLEFRLGEMTFEYRVLLKRIIHCNAMVRKFKEEIPTALPVQFILPDSKKILDYAKVIDSNNTRLLSLQAKIARLEQEQKEKEEKENQKTGIIDEAITFKSRTHIVE